MSCVLRVERVTVQFEYPSKPDLVPELVSCYRSSDTFQILWHNIIFSTFLRLYLRIYCTFCYIPVFTVVFFLPVHLKILSMSFYMSIFFLEKSSLCLMLIKILNWHFNYVPVSTNEGYWWTRIYILIPLRREREGTKVDRISRDVGEVTRKGGKRMEQVKIRKSHEWK